MDSSTGKTSVLHVGKYYPPECGGIESHIQLLSEELTKWVKVRVLAAKGSHSQLDKDRESAAFRFRPMFTLAVRPLPRNGPTNSLFRCRSGPPSFT